MWTMWMMWTLWHCKCMSSQVESIITFATIKRFNNEKRDLTYTEFFYILYLILFLCFHVHFLLNSPFVFGWSLNWIHCFFFILFFFHSLKRFYLDNWNAKRIRHHFKQCEKKENIIESNIWRLLVENPLTNARRGTNSTQLAELKMSSFEWCN